jgi:hypothetical protein
MQTFLIDWGNLKGSHALKSHNQATKGKVAVSEEES